MFGILFLLPFAELLKNILVIHYRYALFFHESFLLFQVLHICAVLRLLKPFAHLFRYVVGLVLYSLEVLLEYRIVLVKIKFVSGKNHSGHQPELRKARSYKAFVHSLYK